MDATSFSDVPQDDCSLEEEWQPDDYHWSPYDMKATKITRHSSKSKRRGRTRVLGPQTCQVEGCLSDLGTLKEYHQRYKICPIHMKAKCIPRDGMQQRFCQQCGRFHHLREFDGGKRSCRVRLAKHNQRRRKKTNESLKRTGSARSSNLSQSNCPTDSNVAVDVDESLTEIETGPQKVAPAFLPSQEQAPYLPRYSGQHVMYRKEHPFTNEPLCNPCNNLSSKPEYDGLSGIPDALGGGGAYQNYFLQEDPIGFVQGIAAANVAPKYVNQSEMTFPGSMPGLPLMMPLTSNVFSGNPLREPVAFIPSKSKRKDTAYSDPCQRNPACFMPPGNNNCVTNPSASPVQCGEAESLAWARLLREDLSSDDSQTASYKCLLRLTSLSVKVFNCTPCHLPTGLRNELLHAVHDGIVPEGYIRPGCVHLIFDVFRPGCRKATSLDDVVSKLLSSQCSFWKKRDIMIQTDDMSILLSSGKIEKRHSMRIDSDLYPRTRVVYPTCVLNSTAQRRFIIQGDNIDSKQSSSIHCRIQGKYVPVIVDDVQGEPKSLSCTLNGEIPCGCLKIEVSKNGMTDQSLSVLSVDDVNVVREIEGFRGQDGSEQSQDFLTELGLAVELRSWLHGVCLQYSATPTDLGTLFRRSVRSGECRGTGFKNTTLAEINCCVLSACHVAAFSKKMGLIHSAEYLQSIVMLTFNSEIDRAPPPPPPSLRINGIKLQGKKKWRLRFMKLLSMKHQARRAVTCF